MPLEEFARLRGLDLSPSVWNAIDAGIRGAAQSIITGKGANYYGIGSSLARIADSILRDQRSVLTVCARTEDVLGVGDVTVSLPRLIGGRGVLETFP